MGLVIVRVVVLVGHITYPIVLQILGKPYHSAVFFVCSLALFLALSVVPEYLGFSFMLGEKALYIRSGILSHQVLAISYREITSIEIVRSKTFFLCNDFVISWHRHGSDETTTLACLSKKLQTELFAFLTR